MAGEHSGDVLGGKLIEALKAKADADAFAFAGVGGEHMEAAGLPSIFPLSDVAVMGPAAILARLPKLVRRVYRAVDAALAFNPTRSSSSTAPSSRTHRKTHPPAPPLDPHHRLCKPKRLGLAPGRARKMRPYVDHLLALLPFEPEAMLRLGAQLALMSAIP